MSDKFFIRARDGGGIRCLASATVLAELEKRLKARQPDKQLHEYFGLIAGTSWQASPGYRMGWHYQ